jgi:hypothetical protein
MTTTIAKALQAEELLAARLADYVGEWVAIRDHEVVEHSESLRGLLVAIEGQTVERILEVTEETGISCFF